MEVYLHAFLMWTLDEGGRSASCPTHFNARERIASTHWIGGWVGPRARMDVVVRRKKSLKLQGVARNQTAVIQPIA
jgi:hypothetical protein